MINESTIIIAAILAILTCALPKKYFLVSFMVAVCFIPHDQRIIIASLDFTPLRILIVFGVLRIFLRGEERNIRWNVFDKVVFGWVICGAVVYVIRQADISAFINRSGVLFDIMGLYWLFRQNIRSWDEVDFVARLLAVCALISALLVLFERVTEYNPFALLGRVNTGIHRGRYRCASSFSHSILLGLFWANLVPIFVAYALTNRPKALFWWAAIIGCTLIVLATASSTPIVTLLWILLLLPLFRYRRYGKQVALGFLGMVLALHIVMDKPVWHLIGRIRFIAGSTGYHRYALINAAIKHFDEWALLGTSTTGHWGYGLVDITNNYIRQGLNGGFITVVLLIVVLVMAISICGKYSSHSLSKRTQWLGWGFCISVLGHCMSFFGVSYFGKSHALLCLTFVIVGMIYDVHAARCRSISSLDLKPYHTRLANS